MFSHCSRIFLGFWKVGSFLDSLFLTLCLCEKGTQIPSKCFLISTSLAIRPPLPCISYLGFLSLWTPTQRERERERERERADIVLGCTVWLFITMNPEIEIQSPASYLQNSNWLYQESKGTNWTLEENKQFENALALYDKDTPDRWLRIAATIPGKTVGDVMKQYRELEEDVSDIEAGLIPIPGYGSNSFTLEWVNNQGFGDLKQFYSVGGKRGASTRPSDQERKKGIPWTEEEHRYVLHALVYNLYKICALTIWNVNEIWLAISWMLVYTIWGGARLIYWESITDPKFLGLRLSYCCYMLVYTTIEPIIRFVFLFVSINHKVWIEMMKLTLYYDVYVWELNFSW